MRRIDWQASHERARGCARKNRAPAHCYGEIAKKNSHSSSLPLSARTVQARARPYGARQYIFLNKEILLNYLIGNVAKKTCKNRIR